MQGTQRLTAIIEREDDGFVSLCPELDIASQGISKSIDFIREEFYSVAFRKKRYTSLEKAANRSGWLAARVS